MPLATPVTTPVAEPIVATDAVLLVHVPPTESVNVVVEPAHTLAVPDIEDGEAFTVITFVVVQPVDKVYVIVELPLATPVTIPVDEPIVATDVVLLDHVPPPASVNVVVKPAHTLAVPDIEDGKVFTVTTVVTYAVPQLALVVL